MAHQDRTPPDPIETQGPDDPGADLYTALAEAPYSFDFFQALRQLECRHRDKPRIGRSAHSNDDPVRFSQEPTMAFAPSTLAAFQRQSGLPPRLAVYFFGLLGPNGALPLHLTEYARDRLRNVHDPTFVRFLDMFHHRLLSLFYRAWADAEPSANLDRPETDRYGLYLGALFGIGPQALRDRDAVKDFAKLHYAGRLVCQTRHPEGLQALLQDFFGIPVGVREFVGHWMTIPEELRCRLGESPETGALGMTTTIGAQVWDRQYKFRLIFGPMSLKDYERLLPGGESLGRLVAWVRNYLGDEMVWDLNLILDRREVPPASLGQFGRLGWTSWLAAQDRDRDADELLLNARYYVDGLGRGSSAS